MPRSHRVVVVAAVLALIATGLALVTRNARVAPVIVGNRVDAPASTAHESLSAPTDRASDARAFADGASADERDESSRASVAIEFAVMDVDAAPVAGAIVHVRVAELARRVGTTDVGGRLRVDVPQRGDVAVVVSHADYATEDMDLEHTRPSKLDVIVHPGDGIRGVVVYEDGTPVDPGSLAVAWPWWTKSPGERLCLRALDGDPGVPFARTDARGEFEIRALDRRRKYQVTAGSKGFVAGQPSSASPGDAPVRVIVRKAFAAWIAFEDMSTREIVRVAPGYVPSAGHWLRIDDGEARVLGTGEFVMALAGLTVEHLLRAPGCFLYVFTASRARPLVGPLALSCAIAGFEPRTFDVYATPLDQPLALQHLPLVPTNPCRGTLLVRVRGGSDADESRTGPEGVLDLYAESGEASKYVLDRLRDGVHAIDDVPCGRYRAVLSAPPSTFMFPPPGAPDAYVEVGDEPATLAVDLTRTGALRIDARFASGAPYGGTMSVMLFEGGVGPGKEVGFEGAGGTVFLRRPPFVIRNLDAKAYSILLFDPSAIGDRPMRAVEVESGKLSRLTFEIR